MSTKRIITCMHERSMLAAAATAALLSALTPVNVTAAEQETSTVGLEEIIVTAQKRAESVQDTPISIAAFSEEMIQETGISNTTDLAIMTPGLTMTQSGSGLLPYIRGVGAVSAAGGSESPVAIFVDGVYFQQGYASDLGLTNVERIEVLKGPQGTLFGRNVTAGLIHIIAKDPSQDSSADIRLSTGNYETYEAEIYGTAGITDHIAADLSVRYRDQGEGYGTNTFLGVDGYYRDEASVRSKWKYTGGDTDVTLTMYFMDIDMDKGHWRRLPPGSVGQGGFVHTGDFWDIQSDNRDNSTYVENKGASIRVDHRFGNLDFLSISAYNDLRGDARAFDNDFSQAPISVAGVDNQTDYFTQELQLQSNSAARHSWIAGLYYLDSHSQVDLALSQVGGAFRTGEMDTTSWAAFGEYTWRFTEATRATAGVRYTKDEREVYGSQLGRPVRRETTDWKEPTYRAVLQHDLSEDVMLYGSYTKGFKSGNYNLINPAAPAVNPEFIDAFEVGMKSSYLDNRLQVNAAAFFYDYSDLQVTIFEGTSTRTVNAAAAEIKGLEVSLAALLADSFRLDLGVSALDGEYTEFRNLAVQSPRRDANGNPTGGNLPPVARDVSGNPLQRTSELTANLGGTYTFEMDSGEIGTSMRAAYTKGFPWEPDGRLREDDYVVVNLTVGWRDASDTWGVGVIGRNIFEEEYSIGTTTTAPNDFYTPGEPATFSAYFDYRF